MISKTIDFKNFLSKKITKKNRKNLLNLLKNNSEIINSLKSNYKDNYNFRRIKKDIKNLEIRIIGIGGSILGSEAIHSFFGKKIKKKFHFINNLTSNYFFKKKKIQ